MPEWSIERLSSTHTRERFTCGKTSLDVFLHTLVTQYEKRGLGRTYVAVKAGEKEIQGYYTLASGSVSFQNLPLAKSKKLPRHPVPVALLGRLAVSKTSQGTGLGKVLLQDAFIRCVELPKSLGIHAVEVFALDEAAKEFYMKFGFTPLLDNDLHLFLPLKTIRDAFGSWLS